jgi:abequosyltransferase
MSPRLSICIPTYNFGEFIGETLRSIVEQASADVEIVIVDGASTDNTEEVVASWRKAFPSLRYVRLLERGGIDHDLAKSVELASGEYCWLFSSDDVMRPYAIQHLRERLNHGHDLYVCEHSICDRDMRKLHDHRIFSDDRVRVVEFGDAKQRQACLAAGRNTEALFSFMSGLIVKRARWLSIEPNTEFLGSCWWHVARLLELARDQLKVCYVSEVWLDKRGDNDSFLERGVVNRLRIAVDGFVGISTHFYGPKSNETENVRRFLRNELSLLSFFYARDRAIQSPQVESKAELDRIFDLCYSNCGLRGRVARMSYYYLPVSIYRRLKSLYKLMRGGVRWARSRAKEMKHA